MNALVTRMPEILLSSAALICAIEIRLCLNASRIFLRRTSAAASRKGMQIKIVSVSFQLIVQR